MNGVPYRHPILYIPTYLLTCSVYTLNIIHIIIIHIIHYFQISDFWKIVDFSLPDG